MIFKKTEQEINQEKFAKKSVKDNTPVCETLYYDQSRAKIRYW